MTPIETVQAFYRALGAGDVPAALGLLAPNIQWTETPHFPYYSGTWTTPQMVLDRLLVPASQDWKGFAANATRFITSGAEVVAIGAYGGLNRATGKPLDAGFAHIWRVEDGLITRFDQYTDTQAVRLAMA